MQPIDVIITSYTRFDLLDKTLTSFFEFNTTPVNKLIVYDDFGFTRMSPEQKHIFRALTEKYAQVTFMCGDHRIGQIKALDKLHTFVETEWYMSCEDDFQFYRPGFIEESYEIMRGRDKCIQVHLREHNDVNGHPIMKHPDGTFRLKTSYKSIWHGFSFNPSLRRISDYKRIGSYSKLATFNPTRPWEAEAAIGKKYMSLGYYAAITPQGYCKHIGNERGIRN